jgi:hypothetical protein
MNYILINNQYTIQRYMYAHNFYSHRFGYSIFVTRFVVIVLHYAKCDLPQSKNVKFYGPALKSGIRTTVVLMLLMAEN